MIHFKHLNSINCLPVEQFKPNLKLLIGLWQFSRLRYIQVYSQLFASLILAVQINGALTAVSRPVLAQIPESLPSEGSIIPIYPEPALPEPQLPEPLPQTEPLFSPSVPILTPPENIPDSPDTIIIEQFNFSGNTVFSEQELAEITKNWVGRPITFMELLQARSAVTDLYINRGYITSGALISAQPLTNGTVTISILEGKVTEINIKGKGRLNPNYIKSRLELVTQKPFNQNHLLQALQLLQLDPVVKTISAELATGIEPGESILNIEFQTAKTFAMNLFTNNNRSPAVGSWQRGIEVKEGNLLGQGDRLELSYSNTQGSSIGDVFYTFPITRRNATLGFYFNSTNSQIIEPPFDDLDIKANSRTYELRFRQPIIRTPTQELALGLTFARRESDTSILGVGFPLSRGSEEDGKTRLSVLRFSQEYTNQGPKQVLAARSQLSFGVGLFDATLSSDQPDSQYFSWRGQAQWVRLLAPETIFLLRSDIQLTNQELLALEQMGLGGLESVRGYRQDVLLRDNVVFASAELRYPILRTKNGEGVLQITPFMDFGQAWNVPGELVLPDRTLLSIGLGLRWQYSDRITAQIDWGIPLIKVNSSDRNLQEQGIYFLLNWKPF
ncbi:ShlB/FhaC/HecB family hemolysin secretion/activation protein [Planktothrix paucivesiculata]|uniref:Surface antigen variable number protein n=1 Tax=Planktothrix paucivesiculata PCC 9631 TaxID=671071 RepID=A0A7Z9C2R3_9CYAN|nr:ShlB/FhaC/HecB family hemolysin secretion/activation protein [Planktothrix paucivesiculata]VXD24122.1 Surface antigen variable number protein [Planktothrix paucivesiculata PCC 9631]